MRWQPVAPTTCRPFACRSPMRLRVTALADGHTAACPSVDGASPTGALGLYQPHGFVRGQAFVRYVLAVREAS